MYQEERPTCVTVIGWAWLVMGGLMALSAAMAIINWNTFGESLLNDPKAPIFVKYFGYIALFQLIFALIGITAGSNFLKRKAWSRSMLEGLTWLMLTFAIGFSIFWVRTGLSMESSTGSPQGIITEMIISGVMITGCFALPLAIMLKYLRGNKVRDAMEKSAH